MQPSRLFARCAISAFLWLLPLIAGAQTLNIHNDVHTYATLTNTVATLTGKAELHVTGTGDPIPSCTIHLNSPDAWFFMTNISPATVSSTFLSRVRVNGVAAVLDSNVRVVQFARWLLVGANWEPVSGAVVIPHAPSFAPMTVYEGRSFTGSSKLLAQYTAYGWMELGGFNDAISSFKLKRGYMATIASEPNGTGTSRNYVAADGDLEVGALPSALNDAVSFVRIFPWRWVSKKGSCDVEPVALKADWHYNWSISWNSAPNWEYVAIKQQPYWPGLNEDWRARGVNHLLGFNEPNNPVEDAYENLNPPGSVSDAVVKWDELLGTGLRVGAPAVTDGGYGWIVDFLNQANAAGKRVDYVPIHYYRSTSGNNPGSAAANLYNFLKSIYDVAQRPIWVTEFNNGANWTDNAHDPSAAQNRDVIEAMINMMDSTPWIERYAIYSNVEWFRDTHYTDGSLTPMGQMYRDHVAPVAYLQEVADAGNGNSARYDFDGNADDASGNGHGGLLAGAPDFAAGKHGQALALNGSSDYMQLSPRIADTTDFTFAAWVYWNGGGNWQRIFDFGLGTQNYLALTTKAGTAGLRFLMRDGGAEQQLNSAALPTGAWVHVAVTITGDTGKLFVNGALVNTNNAMTINPVDIGTKYNFLGKSQFMADPNFNGLLDDVRILSSALSDAQIAAIVASAPPQFSSNTLIKPAAIERQPYTGSIAADATGGSGARTFTKLGGPAWLAVAQNGSLTGVPTLTDGGTNTFYVRVTDANGAISSAVLQIPVTEAPGLTARYAFDNTVAATVGNANGTATGSPVYTAGRYGETLGAIVFDGTDDVVALPHGVANHAEITISTWVYWNGGANWQRIFDFGNGTGEYLMLSPKSGATGNLLRFDIVQNGVTRTLETTTLPSAQWVHVAVTLGAGTGRLYVNGTLRDTDTITIKPSDISPALNYLGDSQFTADPLFTGRLDEFQIFNQALTAAQITAIYNNGRAPVFSPDPISKPAATAGQSYEQTLAGAATDPNAGTALSYSKVSGPAWLSVASNGRIYGVPAANDAGPNRFVVRATDLTLLSDDAVVNINVAAASSGLIVHYALDGNLLTTTGGAAGTPTGSPAYEDGLFDKALGFDGTNDLVTLPANIVGALTDATFAARVRWDGGSAWQRIFDFGAGTAQYMILTPSSGGGAVQFAILNSGGTAQRLEGSAPLAVGEWAHVAVTLIGNTGTLYVNGAAVASGSITIDPAAITQTANYLGDSQFAADPFFNGAIDDFRIYNRGLSAAEISALAVPPAAIFVPDSSYAGWSAGIAFPGGESGAVADPDNDGLANAWEYWFGSDPLLAGSGALPPPEIRTAASLGLGATGKTYLTIQARVRKNHLSASLAAEAAPSIADLALPDASSHALQAGPPVADGEFEIFTFYFDTALEDSPTGTGFIRLRTVVQ